MIIKASHHFIIYNFFKIFTRLMLRRKFHSVVFDGKNIQTEKPILLIANHVSWWDGFWILYLNMKLFRKKFYFMMLEQQLKKFWFFKFSGGFSVHKSSKSIIETIHYTTELLKDNNNLVLIFPQGEIKSMHQQEIRFEKGLERIVTGAKNKIEIVMVVNLIDYFSNPKPTLYMYYQSFEYDMFHLSKFEESYQVFFNQCIQKQLKLNRQ